MIEEMPLLTGKTLHEKQYMFFNGSHCSYCGKPTELIDSGRVYQQSHGLLLICFQCSAWVGCMPNSDQSLGMVAKEGLRKLRIKTNELISPLVTLKATGSNKKRNAAQALFRNWLAEKLGINPLECHVAMMGTDRCKQVIGICEEVYRDLEVKKIQRDHNTKWNVDAVYFYQQDLEEIYTVKEDKMNNFHLLTLTHKVSGLQLKIKPKENSYSTNTGKEKWKSFDSVETLIYSHFKPKEK